MDELKAAGPGVSASSPASKAKDEKTYAQKRLESMQSAASGMEEMAKEAPLAAQKTLLHAMTKRCEMLSAQMYTKKSWSALMKAYAKAKAVVLGDNPTLKQMKRHAAVLRARLAALEPAETEPDDDKKRERLPLVQKLSLKNQNALAAETDAAAPVPPEVDVSV